MAAFLEIPSSTYIGFENLTIHPNNSELLMEHAEKMAFVLETSVSRLFPKSLTKIKLNKVTKEIDADQIISPNGTPKEVLQIESRELTRVIDLKLAMLSRREEMVLRKRFGLGEEDEHTLKDIGDLIEVGKERIRYNEACALRKLRHPTIAKDLEDY